jgi:hypothetical protein
MDHSRKIETARRLFTVGTMPHTWSDIIDSVPRSVIDTVPARALADLVDAIRIVSLDQQARGQQDALDEGAIWDPRLQRLREIED